MRRILHFIKRLLPTNWQERINKYQKERRILASNLLIVDRHPSPYTTHLPVLVGLAHIIKPRKILEFGSGEHSTLAFLDKSAFPDLMQLVSVENDSEWYEVVKKKVGEDSRLDLRLVAGAISDSVAGIDVSRFDMIFIDDSTSHETRSATIRAVAKHCAATTIIAIHDFQDQPYRNAANSFQNIFYFNQLNPAVGVVWNEYPMRIRTLKHINYQIYRNSHLSPDDIDAWVKVFSRNWFVRKIEMMRSYFSGN